MNIDRYTKTVLTVIAVCLIWISLGGPSLLTPVAAQNNVQDVAIVGWKQGDFLHQLQVKPLPVATPARQIARSRASFRRSSPPFLQRQRDQHN